MSGDVGMEGGITIGACVFTAERVEKRDGDEVTLSYAVKNFDGIEVLERSASTHPMRELFWGCVLVAAGLSVAFNAPMSVRKMVGGFLLCGVGAWVLVNLLRRVTCARVYRQGGYVDVALGVVLTREERVKLNRRLAKELRYRVPGRATE